MKILGNVKSNSLFICLGFLVDGRRSCPSGPPGLRPRESEAGAEGRERS